MVAAANARPYGAVGPGNIRAPKSWSKPGLAQGLEELGHTGGHASGMAPDLQGTSGASRGFVQPPASLGATISGAAAGRGLPKRRVLRSRDPLAPLAYSTWSTSPVSLQCLREREAQAVVPPTVQQGRGRPPARKARLNLLPQCPPSPTPAARQRHWPCCGKKL